MSAQIAKNLRKEGEMGMARVIYSENQINEFIEEAKIRGIGPASRFLGYPDPDTGRRWFQQRGVAVPTVDSLMARAAELKRFYGDAEKKAALQVLMDRIVGMAEQNDLDADALNKLANAMAKLIQTFQLVEGKATTVQESRTKDATDLAIADMLGKMKAQNELKEKELS